MADLIFNDTNTGAFDPDRVTEVSFTDDFLNEEEHGKQIVATLDGTRVFTLQDVTGEPLSVVKARLKEWVEEINNARTKITRVRMVP